MEEASSRCDALSSWIVPVYDGLCTRSGSYLEGATVRESGKFSRVLHEIFLERGSMDEVLMDNGAAFRSQALKNMLDKWNVRRYLELHIDRVGME